MSLWAKQIVFEDPVVSKRVARVKTEMLGRKLISMEEMNEITRLIGLGKKFEELPEWAQVAVKECERQLRAEGALR